MKQKTPLGYWEGGNIHARSRMKKLSLRPFRMSTDPFTWSEKMTKSISPGMAMWHWILLQPSQCPLTAEGRYPLVAIVPPLSPKSLGDPYFKSLLGLEYAYVVGAMANGITSVEMVEAAARAGMVGFFGAAGLDVASIEQAIGQLKQRLATCHTASTSFTAPVTLNLNLQPSVFTWNTASTW